MDINDEYKNEKENGSLSIETSLVLPIFILVLLIFIYLINYSSFNDFIISRVCTDLIESKTITYEEYKNNLPIYYKINDDYEFGRIDNLKITSELNNYDDNEIDVNISYTYNVPLNMIDDFEVYKNINSKIFTSGISMLDYGLNNEYIKSDFDVWTLSNLNRAHEINSIMDGVSNFDGTTIDKIYNGYLVSIVSLDYRKNSYNNDYAILNKIKNDANDLIRFEEGNALNTYISKDDYKGKILNIILPNDEYDNNVKQQLGLGKIYCNNKNIQFKITIIE